MCYKNKIGIVLLYNQLKKTSNPFKTSQKTSLSRLGHYPAKGNVVRNLANVLEKLSQSLKQMFFRVTLIHCLIIEVICL